MVLGDASTTDAHAHDVLAGQITMSGIDVIVSHVAGLDVHAHLLLLHNAGHIIRVHYCKRSRNKHGQLLATNATLYGRRTTDAGHWSPLNSPERAML